MSKEMYEKPEIEVISLLDVRIITDSAEEAGEGELNSEEENNNSIENEVDESPWTEDGENQENGLLENPEADPTQEGTPIENVPEVIPNDTPIDNENIIPDDVPIENIPENIPADDNIDVQ